MHIPDGFLNVATVATTCAVSAGGIGGAVRMVGKKLGEKQVPLMGILAAFIFAAQMLNFPVAGGTSGHVIGAALAAILLGPWAAVLIMSCVLIAQSLIFQDGGLLALGANIFNMGIVASFSGYYIYRLVSWLAGATAGALSSAASSPPGSRCSWLPSFAPSSWRSRARPHSGWCLPAMAGVHALIGIGEGLITGAVLSPGAGDQSRPFAAATYLINGG